MNTPVHEYIATKRDFLNAQRLHRSNRPWTAFAYCLWFYGVPGISMLYLVYFVVNWHLILAANRPSLGAVAGVAAYFLILLPLARVWQIRKLWDQAQPRKYRGKPITVQFDQEMIIGTRPAESEGRFYWTAIEDYAEDERIALVYVRRKLFMFIPKRAMDEPEWERLRALAMPYKAKR